jgi:aminocarboxymuconate-semialdehyde decarboxylase
MSPKRVDTHFHFVPESFAQAIAATGSNPSGPWDLPKWSLESAIAAMDMLGTSKGILSATTPGPGIAGYGDAGRTLAREMNKETLAVVQKNPKRFGWFASLPDWTDVQGTLDEIEWAFNVAKADGVVIMSLYNNL